MAEREGCAPTRNGLNNEYQRGRNMRGPKVNRVEQDFASRTLIR